MGIETGGPSPEEMMNFKIPESQPEAPQEKQQEAKQEAPKESAPEGQVPFVAELDSRNPDKYEIGQDFDNGEYKGKVVGIDKESGKIKVEVKAKDKKEEEIPLMEVGSSDTSKHHIGEALKVDGEDVVVKSINHMRGLLYVEKIGKKEEEPKM
jgi:hypothetical protein